MPENIHLCLSDLIDQDLSSYEYYQSLPESTRRKVAEADVCSFEEMQALVLKLERKKHGSEI